MKIVNSRYLDYLIILTILLLGVWQLFSFQATMKWDAVDITLPWKFYITEGLRNGDLPLWNPFVRNGFAQMGESSNWYPISWIFGFFHRYDLAGLHFEYIFHLYVAGLGFYKFCSLFSFNRFIKILLAICYMFSGFFIGNAQHLGWIISAAWLLYVVYYFVSLYKSPSLSNAIKLALVLFLMLSGGYPGIFIITVYCLVVFFIVELTRLLQLKKHKELKVWIAYLVGSSILFLMMSSVVLVASFDLAKYITRGYLMGQHIQLDILEGSFPVKGIISFLFPYGASINNLAFWKEDFSLVNIYIGIIPLTFIFLTLTVKSQFFKKSITFFLLGILFLSLAMATFFPFREWLSILPFMELFRFPSIFRVFAIICFLIVAGYGLENTFLEVQTKKQIIKKSILALITMLIVPLIFLGFKLYDTNPNLTVDEFLNSKKDISGVYIRMLWSGLLAVFFVIGIIVSLAILERKKAIYLICIIGVLDVSEAFRLNASGTLFDKYNVKSINNKLAKIPVGFPKPSLDVAVSELNDKNFQGRIPFLWRNLGMFHKSPSSGGYGPYTFNSEELSRNKGLYDDIIKNPLLFLASDVSDGLVDVKSILPNSSEYITIIAYSQNNILVNINAEEKAYLIFLQNIYPDWVVSVNGSKKEIITINETFMGVNLEKGVSVVEFDFKPNKVVFAFYLSLTVLVIVSCLLVFFFWKDHREEWKIIVGYLGFILFFILLYFNFSSSNIITTKKNGSNKRLISKNNFENDVKFWSSYLADNKIFNNGGQSAKLDSTVEYSSTFKQTFKYFGEEEIKTIYISAYLKCENQATPQFVFQVERDGEKVVWKNKPFKTEFNSENNNWKKVEFKLNIKEFDILPNDEIGIYLWNENKKNIWIDDFVIEVE